MASYATELLGAAKVLLAREPRKRGRLADARIRRAISTTYYALFHFLIEEATKRLVGSDNFLRIRRRVLARSFAHAGLGSTFNKIRGQNVEQSVEDFFRGINVAAGQVPTPVFARNLARVFLDAYAKREDADYNRNESLSEADASILNTRVEGAIHVWSTTNDPNARDFKNAVYMLMLLKGQLRKDNQT